MFNPQIKANVILFVFNLIVVLSLAQPNQIDLQIGFGKFQMTDLKGLQDSFIKESIIPLSKTVEFPDYFVFDLKYEHEIKDKFFTGGSVGHRSTGGRLHYADYSGEVYSNQKVSAYSIALLGGLYLLNDKKNIVPLYLRVGGNFTRVSLENGIIVGTQKQEQSDLFESFGMLAEPGVSYRRIIRQLFTGVDIGYELNFNGNLFYSSDKNLFLVNDSGNPVQAQWDGLRVRLSIGYRF